ncbi:hypothetical protein [Micromonospora taraxaci]|uniref:hypothetical protein n=1 Tax=Micromonospora taraxaci TaxID=1316803 RepID=UPI0033A8A588
MVAVWRDESGRLHAWRAGRRRLAWRPRFPQAAWLADGYIGPFELLVLPVFLLIGLGYLVTWLAALLATVVVWPYRAVSGRWPVVAYPLDSSPVATDDQRGDRPYRQQVTGRAAGAALTQQWARTIERHGHPEPAPTPSR